MTRPLVNICVKLRLWRPRGYTHYPQQASRLTLNVWRISNYRHRENSLARCDASLIHVSIEEMAVRAIKEWTKPFLKKCVGPVIALLCVRLC